MKILLTLSNKNFLFFQNSDVLSIPITHQGSINDKMIRKELTAYPQIVKIGENEENSDNKYLPINRIEDCGRDFYIDYGFDSSLPPYLSMIYNESRECWLIAILECFKSNKELRKYIFKNVQNDAFLKGLKNVLQIHKSKITEKDFDLLMSIYIDNEKPIRSRGDNSLLFIINLIECCFFLETLEGIDEQRVEPFFHIPPKLIKGDSNSKVGFVPEVNMPFIQINIPKELHQNDYLKIDDYFPSTESPLSSLDDCSDYIILNRKANFLILNIFHRVTYEALGINFKGIVILKPLFFTTFDKQKLKYTLTSILYAQKKNNKYFNHEAAYVKRNDKWYSSEYELDIYNSRIFHFCSFSIEPSLIAALDDINKKEVIFDAAEYENKLLISFLFYQIEE